MKNLKANEPITIGYMRDDGDLQVLATLNNVDEVIPHDVYLNLARTLCVVLEGTGEKIIAVNRWDTPDYVNLDEDEMEAL
jgi:hypothetical protein